MRALALIITILMATSAVSASAQVMQSTNYRIEKDSINTGGAYGESANYTLETTVGEVATGFSSSTSYTVSAGYQGMDTVYLALSSPADVALAPALSGVTGGTSNGSTTVTATTDSPAGYELFIAASDAPAMQSDADAIDDYAPAGAAPDFSFAVSAGQAFFGFSPEGADIAARFKDDGATCNVGASDTALSCWDGLATSDELIATRASANHPAGTDTSLNFRVGMGASTVITPGTYVATTTLTLLPL